MASLSNRVISIYNRKTSMRLAPAEWEAIDTICRRENIILPLIIKFGLSFRTADIKAVLGISNVIGLSLQLAVIFGLMFQFPLITYMLIRSGITSYAAVAAKRPYIFTAILIIAAILTPPDIVSQLMLAVPTYILFELGLYCSRKFAP